MLARDSGNQRCSVNFKQGRIEMGAESYLSKAKELYQKAVEEFNRAREKRDGVVLRDACGKGWLSAIEATNAFLLNKGVKEEELPGVERGRRYMLFKYASKEIRSLYLSLRDVFHMQGYYEGTLEFDEMKEYLEDLNSYIQKIEKL